MNSKVVPIRPNLKQSPELTVEDFEGSNIPDKLLFKIAALFDRNLEKQHRGAFRLHIPFQAPHRHVCAIREYMTRNEVLCEILNARGPMNCQHLGINTMITASTSPQQQSQRNESETVSLIYAAIIMLEMTGLLEPAEISGLRSKLILRYTGKNH